MLNTLSDFDLKEPRDYAIFLHFLVHCETSLECRLLQPSRKENTHMHSKGASAIFHFLFRFLTVPAMSPVHDPQKEAFWFGKYFLCSAFFFFPSKHIIPHSLPPERCSDHVIVSPLFSLNLKTEDFQ